MRLIRNQPPYLGAMTWAALFALSTAGLAVGTQVLITDWNQPFIWSGTQWNPVGGSVRLAQAGTILSLTGTTAQTSLASFNVPGGVMGATGRIELEFQCTMATNGGATTIIGTKIGGITVMSLTSTANPSAELSYRHTMRNISASDQRHLGLNSRGDALVQAVRASDRALDTSAAFTMEIIAIPGSTATSLTITGYSATLHK
ncbi:hypothetical protein [Pseudacidovorax sp. NFM-22]|uniref:hypothetical protein n=1 Tax=Pseudacidovorax sp. NFM-22 TaxID=2744469 RepID=UPI001F306F2D|nr:hypothetical protein [Pseudacidovorax sp. NFM-22]